MTNQKLRDTLLEQTDLTPEQVDQVVGVVLDGRVLVPEEPTEEMVKAGLKSLFQRMLSTKPETRIEGAYYSMIKAAKGE